MKKLINIYREDAITEFKNKFGYKNHLAIPKIKKISINIGVGKAVSDPKILKDLKNDLTKITGQLPVPTKAKKSISGFKLRQGEVIGLKVTLRKKRMYDFLEKLVNIVLPRIRDFRGVSETCFDEMGNYNMGIREQIVFPEIDYDKVVQVHPLQITIVTTAKNSNDAKKLLSLLGFPFKK